MATTIKIGCLPVAVTALMVATSVSAQEIPPPAYQIAAQTAGVPSEVLYAVALTESGIGLAGKTRPWPWTLNVAGKGRFFRTRNDACVALTETLKTVSEKRIDVGLGQVNYGYHTERVTNPCELLDPYKSLAIAATILKEQHRENEAWLITMGRYHSPANGQRAIAYRSIANQHLVRITAPQP